MNTYKGKTDTDLILTFQATQDPLAFGELFQRYHKKVYLHSAKILKDREAAMDLTQEIFIKLNSRLQQLKEPVTFVKWLFRITHNESIDLIRKNKKHKLTPINNKEWAYEEDTFSDDKEKSVNRLMQVIEQIPTLDKKILEEKYFEQKSIAELMVQYGLSESAVKMRLSRSRGKIRNLFHIA